MIKFKIDILLELKQKGYNTNYLRTHKLLSEATIQQLRRGEVPGIKTIDKLCLLLKKQPGQLLEYIPDVKPGSDQENQEQTTTE